MEHCDASDLVGKAEDMHGTVSPVDLVCTTEEVQGTV